MGFLPFLTSSLLMDSELNMLRWHRTVRLAISSPETSTTLLQEAVGCKRTKQNQSLRANIQYKHSHGSLIGGGNLQKDLKNKFQEKETQE